MSTVVVIDYGSSNLRSVAKALEHVSGSDHSIRVSDQAATILAADRIVFPGQGAIGQCMSRLREKGLGEVIAECISEKPFLGICLGLQTLLDESDEDGGTLGLGIVAGHVRRFRDNQRGRDGSRCKIPHMGWNTVSQKQPHPLWNGIADNTRFYFVHSYYVEPENTGDVAGTTDYTLEFASAIARNKLFATQFHPEKSQQAGLRLLSNFLDWSP